MPNKVKYRILKKVDCKKIQQFGTFLTFFFQLGSIFSSLAVRLNLDTSLALT